MKTLIESEIRDGIIYGDNVNSEYVYMPASEIGVKHPLCIFETSTEKEDISMNEALMIITKHSLKPVKHPRLGISSC